MAGSLRWFVYVTDDGQEFAALLDESNTEAIAAQDQNWTTADPIYSLPGNLKPREAVFQNAAGTRNLRVVVPTKALYDALTPASTIPDQIAGGGATLTFVRKRNEVLRRTPSAADTGLNDGDNP